ncbi:hypothetical protein DQ04_01631030 [Trypanosoma grayi]|uniref:hypothetical protein n=1 Tax=Trypanosoma grayi TaxID=71804 RepID=UPI0004F44641|nr:hypothetical protein DQ04_01631030 [Trypanosoma grayi]KEG12537.1 hypothetical protein DQ04_01631030 [Trypanosoma grayi]
MHSRHRSVTPTPTATVRRRLLRSSSHVLLPTQASGAATPRTGRRTQPSVSCALADAVTDPEHPWRAAPPQKGILKQPHACRSPPAGDADDGTTKTLVDVREDGGGSGGDPPRRKSESHCRCVHFDEESIMASGMGDSVILRDSDLGISRHGVDLAALGVELPSVPLISKLRPLVQWDDDSQWFNEQFGLATQQSGTYENTDKSISNSNINNNDNVDKNNFISISSRSSNSSGIKRLDGKSSVVTARAENELISSTRFVRPRKTVPWVREKVDAPWERSAMYATSCSSRGSLLASVSSGGTQLRGGSTPRVTAERSTSSGGTNRGGESSVAVASPRLQLTTRCRAISSRPILNSPRLGDDLRVELRHHYQKQQQQQPWRPCRRFTAT